MNSHDFQVVEQDLPKTIIVLWYIYPRAKARGKLFE